MAASKRLLAAALAVSGAWARAEDFAAATLGDAEIVEALGADEACAASSGERAAAACALNALQLKKALKAGAPGDAAACTEGLMGQLRLLSPKCHQAFATCGACAAFVEFMTVRDAEGKAAANRVLSKDQSEFTCVTLNENFAACQAVGDEGSDASVAEQLAPLTAAVDALSAAAKMQAAPAAGACDEGAVGQIKEKSPECAAAFVDCSACAVANENADIYAKEGEAASYRDLCTHQEEWTCVFSSPHWSACEAMGSDASLGELLAPLAAAARLASPMGAARVGEKASGASLLMSLKGFPAGAC